MQKSLVLLAAATLAGTAALAAQPAAQPAPAAAAQSVQAGTYQVDADHTQVVWSVDHFGFNRLYGMVGSMSGTLEIDPARPSAAKVDAGGMGMIGRRAKGAADLPPEAAKAAQAFVAEGIFKSVDDYARDYFSQTGG